MKTLLIASFLLVTATAASQQSDNYVFRNDDRPTFDDAVSVGDLHDLQGAKNVVLLDVRLLEDFEADPVLIPGAEYKNPEDIVAWSSALPEDAKVVVYCVKGKWVSQKVAHYLDEKGFEVASLEGGIEAWKQETDQ